ncbi:MAG: hypothetical protein WCI74_00595 [Actinomycetes bacterium]
MDDAEKVTDQPSEDQQALSLEDLEDVSGGSLFFPSDFGGVRSPSPTRTATPDDFRLQQGGGVAPMVT